MEISERPKRNTIRGCRRDYELVNKFLAVCQEALRLEFGFGEKRLGRFGSRVESILDCINSDYVSFEDLERECIKE